MGDYERGKRTERARIYAILRLVSGDDWSLHAALQLAFCSNATPQIARTVIENMRRLRSGRSPTGHPQHEPDSAPH